MAPPGCDKKLAIVFATPVEECVTRVMTRQGHPSLKPGAKSAGIVRGFRTQLEAPREAEGLTQVVSMAPHSLHSTVEDVGNFLMQWQTNNKPASSASPSTSAASSLSALASAETMQKAPAKSKGVVNSFSALSMGDESEEDE